MLTEMAGSMTRMTKAVGSEQRQTSSSNNSQRLTAFEALVAIEPNQMMKNMGCEKVHRCLRMTTTVRTPTTLGPDTCLRTVGTRPYLWDMK